MGKRLTTVEECLEEVQKVVGRAHEQGPDYETLGDGRPTATVVNMKTKAVYSVDVVRGRCTCNYQIQADDMNDILFAEGEPLAVCKHVRMARSALDRRGLAWLIAQAVHK